MNAVRAITPSSPLLPYVRRILLGEPTPGRTGQPWHIAFAYSEGDTVGAAGTGEQSICIVLTDLGASLYFNTPLTQLSDCRSGLCALIAAGAALLIERQLGLVNGMEERVAVLEEVLLLLAGKRKDAAVELAVRQICAAGGNLRIAALAQELGISGGRLEKRFRVMTGTTPKKYASVVRIRSVIRNYTLNASLTASAYDAGYFDQAHLIRAFKAFTGSTPRQYFQRSRKGIKCLSA